MPRVLLLALRSRDSVPRRHCASSRRDDLRVINFDPTGAYLVPYATQCFLNALAAQHARFGYTPDGKPTVLLQDFSDRGNATASEHAAEQGLFRHRSADAGVRDLQPG